MPRHIVWSAMALVAACSHPTPPRLPMPPAAPITTRAPASPAKPVSPWPVPMRAFAWTADGVAPIGELPGTFTPPAMGTWYVEPLHPIDEATLAKIVVALRSEHVPGLSLRGQPVTGGWLDHLRELPELTALLLDDTGVDAAALAHLDLPLHRLYMARTEVDDAGVAALVAHPWAAGLEVLDLEDCAVSDKAMAGIGKLAQLHALNLSGTQLSDRGGAQLVALAKLAILDLGDTKVGVRTIAAIHRLPLVEIFLDRTFVGGEIATLADIAPYVTRFDVSQLQTYHPTDADLAWLAAAPNLVEAGLSGADVHDKLVQQLVAQPKLRRLRLAAAPITLPTVQAIAKLDLEQIDLAQTPLDDASAAALLAQPHLRVARFDKTAITDAALPETPSDALAELYLSETRVTDAGLRILARTPKLEALGLGALGAGDATVARIAQLAALTTLVLSQAKASAAALGDLRALTSLERLYLDNTHADDSTVLALAGSRALRTLHLANTDVSEMSLPVLRTLTQLDELTLGDTRMHGGAADLAAWPHLRTVSLMGLDLGDADLAGIAARTSLVTVDLSNTDVTDPAPLAQLPRLRTLGVVGARISAAGKATVKALEKRGVLVVD